MNCLRSGGLIVKMFFVGALFTLFAATAQAGVWQTRTQWNADWEKKFNSWVASPEWHKDFFVQAGPLQNLKLDCADAVYSMRLIFAAKHGLPFVINDPTGGARPISNEMTRWDSLSANQRLRSFVSYIYGIASTHSLPNDTYPVAVNRTAMGAGALILTDAKSRHTWTVKYLSETGVPFTLSRSRPPTTPMFEHYEFPPADYVFAGGLSPERHAGFRRFRQPADIKRSVWEVPGYSTEQYKIPLASWNETIQKKMATRSETVEERMTRILEGACRGGRDRGLVVALGNSFLSGLGNQCMNDSQYDDYSTPSRDKRLRMTFAQLVREAQMAQGKLPSSLQTKINSVLEGESSANDSSPYCRVAIGDGLSLTLGQIYERLLQGKLSISPHDTLKMRWGFAQFPSERAKRCGR